MSGEIQRRIRAEFRRSCHIIRKHIVDETRDLRINRAAFFLLILFEHISSVVFDAQDPGCGIPHPVIREDAVGTCHVEELHLPAAEDEREAVAPRVFKRRDTHIARGLDGILDAREIDRFHRGDVHRLRYRVTQLHGAMEHAIVILRRIAWRRIVHGIGRCAGGRELCLHVEDDRVRGEAFLERGRVDERLE